MGEGGKAATLYERAIAADPSLANDKLEQKFKVRQLNPNSADVIDLAGRRTSNIKLVSDAPPEPVVTMRFTDIGGLTNVKDQIRRRIILPFQKKSLFDKFKRKAGGGILFYGPPGCGKTLLAKATAGECNANFFPVRIPDVLDMYIGESEKHLAGIFAAARQKTPAVIFFDEIEAIAAKRRFDTNSTQSSLVSTFLSEMDGFGSNNKDILVLAATNVPWAIDSAFRRPGRFDRVMFIPPPDVEAREQILKILMNDRPLEKNTNVRMIAELTPGFSGADLRAVADEATDLAIDDSLERDSENITPISLGHLKEAARSRKATTIEWLTSARNYAKYNNEGGLYDDVVEFLEKHTKS
jgi:transitional endoplasmic reticulum ATPase